ncbi:hypothetical protein GGI20_000855 [Coemansia sp. BCRC 34301]|nr:hypothetical protein GGI20_000855 [Coemansia sp. BCRC 34301]
MVEPVNIGLFTVPESLSHIVSGFRKGAVKLQTHSKDTSPGAMPIIGGHKTLASLLHLSSSTKSESRAAFNIYAGSLSATARDHSRPGFSDNDGPPAIGAGVSMGTCITLNVRYVAKDMWRKVTFPPGITVTQARDICMLRFSIWQQTMNQESGAEGGADGGICVGYHRPSTDQRNDELHKSPHIEPHGSKNGATAGMDGIAGSGCGGSSQNAVTQFRDQFGLFWTASGHWLEADEMLSMYPLRKGDVLELQHIVDFVPLQPEEFKYSYAEGHIFCLHADSATSSSWRLRWAVLRCLVLRLYRQKGQAEADVVIDLAQSFNLTDQGSRSWPRNASKMNEVVSVLSTLDMPPISLHPEALPGRHVTGDGGILVLQAMTSGSRAASQAHKSSRSAFVFCTSSASEYEVWQHSLRQTQTLGTDSTNSGTGVASSVSPSVSHNAKSPNTISSSATLRGGSSSPGDMHGAGKPAGGNVAEVGGSRPYVVGQTMSSALSPKINQRPRAPSSSTRHEGYVNRKASDGYGFRRRYCVLTPSTLFGFMSANNCKDCADDMQLMANCEFAVSLDASSVTIEAIAWNGRYLLRVFGPDSHCLRDKPRTTSLQPDENARIHCTDILATAAEAAIEQYGSTFGMLPDSRELVRLMVEDHDDGQLWAVGFNSIAGLQITSQAKVIISARRSAQSAESRPHNPLGDSTSGRSSAHSSAERLSHGLPPQDEGDISATTTASSSPGVGKQQSLSEFIVSHMEPIAGKSAKKPPPLSAPLRRPDAVLRQPLASPSSVHGHEGSGSSMEGHHNGGAGPKWIPLSIDKYIKEEEERKRHNGSSVHSSMAGLPLTASSDGSSSNRILSSKASNISDRDHHFHHNQGSYGSARPPPRFNWFKRRGSTSK